MTRKTSRGLAGTPVAAKAPNGASISAAIQSRPTMEHAVSKVKIAMIQGLVSLRSHGVPMHCPAEVGHRGIVGIWDQTPKTTCFKNVKVTMCR